MSNIDQWAEQLARRTREKQEWKRQQDLKTLSDRRLLETRAAHAWNDACTENKRGGDDPTR